MQFFNKTISHPKLLTMIAVFFTFIDSKMGFISNDCLSNAQLQEIFG